MTNLQRLIVGQVTLSLSVLTVAALFIFSNMDFQSDLNRNASLELRAIITAIENKRFKQFLSKHALPDVGENVSPKLASGIESAFERLPHQAPWTLNLDSAELFTNPASNRLKTVAQLNLRGKTLRIATWHLQQHNKWKLAALSIKDPLITSNKRHCPNCRIKYSPIDVPCPKCEYAPDSNDLFTQVSELLLATDSATEQMDEREPNIP